MAGIVVDWMGDMINWASDNIGIALSIFTIIGGVIGFITNFLLKFVIETNKMKTDKKKLEQQKESLQHKIETDKKKLEQQKESLQHQMIIVRQQMITNNIAPMRQDWINDLRSKVSEFSMLAKMIRINIYRNFGTAQALSESKFESASISITKDIYKLNALSSYLDLLLPFNVEGEERKEETAEKLRLAIQNTVDGCENLMDSIQMSIKGHGGPVENPQNDASLILIANSILTSIESVSTEAKMLLLEEWRETKSLKELE